MIRFRCPKCGLELRAKDEFVGRATQCPTCKHAFAVPHPDATQAYVGPANTTPEDGTLAGPKTPPVRERNASAGRYVIDREIARGGMGVVLRAFDDDLRREVAVKCLLDDRNPERRARFVEEAQITGQLEHPNIVPIHELGIDAQGRAFFAMKMVHGKSLAEVLASLRDGADDAKEWTLVRRLGVLVNVCHAIRYAHSRSVLHRDLKPANVMVGEFGEVYVMDWGLAKLLASDPPAAAPETLVDQVASGKVATTRNEVSDATVDGAVLGTPAYMAPEQARGDVSALDERTDVYALGALLYEILALRPPIDREGGYATVLERVRQGEIAAPEKVAPRSVGVIPQELSAIAMKALAREPSRRYSSALAFRKDIERFLDGRAVSARGDSAWQMAVRLVKRNLAVSATAALSLVVLASVLGVAYQTNSSARSAAEAAQKKAETAFADQQKEQRAKEDAIRKAVPAMLRAGRQLANEADLAGAALQTEAALAFDPKNLDAALFQAQLAVAKKEWKKAQSLLATYRQTRPYDVDATRLMGTAEPGKEADEGTLVDLATAFQNQKLYGLSQHLLQDLAKTIETRKRLYPLYHKQIEAAWPGLGAKFHLLPNGQIRFDAAHRTEIADLSPLRGMDLQQLDLGLTPIATLEPLRGMKLVRLVLTGCKKVTDVGPLQGMPLRSMLIDSTSVSDLKPLEGMPLEDLLLAFAPVRDLEPLRGMKLRRFLLHGCGQVRNLSAIESQPIEELSLGSCTLIRDLAPLATLRIKSLALNGCYSVTDLSPLRELPLEYLDLTGLNVDDVSEIRKMPLRRLVLSSMPNLKSLAPLEGLKLESLDMYECAASDLRPLKNVPLVEIGLTPEKIATGWDELRAMKTLKTVMTTPTRRFDAADFWRRFDAGEFKKK